MLSRRILCLLIVACALAAACKRKPALPPDVVVRVGERNVTVGDFKRYLLRNAGAELAQVTPEVASAMLDQFVEEVVLSEYAAAHGVEVPAEKIAAEVRTEAGSTVMEKRDEMRREKLLLNVATDVPEPSPEEIRAYYEQHPGEFRTGEEVRVRQILVNDEAIASQIIQKLNGGADFGALSVEFSRAPNAKRGGEIGYISRGELPKMFEDVIFGLQPGQVSEVIRTDSTFHIFKVEERRAPGTVDLAAAEPLIRTRLKEESIREHVAQLTASSRKEMQIAVLTRRLPFRYSGSLPTAADE